MSSVFISFDYGDIASKKAVDNWANQGMGTDINLYAWDGESESNKGADYVKQNIRDMINKSDTVLVLVGDDTHNRPWVDYEVNHGLCHGKKVIWTQLPGTSGAPPEKLRGQAPVPFDMRALEKTIRSGQ